MTTQFAKASYQEIIDLKTVSDNVTVVGIHTPTSKQPYEYLSGFFRQFKKYRYLGCSMALVPAARLPNDIAQVGYGAGSQPVDARDILNPILFHGCHGDALGPILNQFLNGPNVGGSFGKPDSTPSTEIWERSFNEGSAWADLYEQLYYRALTDNTWLKAHPQSGFRKKGLHPMIYDVSTNHPIGNIPNGHYPLNPNVNGMYDENPLRAGTMGVAVPANSGSNNYYGFLAEDYCEGPFDVVDPTANDNGKLKHVATVQGYNYFTSKLHPLGWIGTTVRIPFMDDTDAVEFSDLAPSTVDLNDFLNMMTEQPNLLPLVYMGIILLPPAYKANQYMRLVLNHHFAFKGFRGISMNSSWKGQANIVGGSNFVNSYYTTIDDENSKDAAKPESEEKILDIKDGENDDFIQYYGE